MRFQQGANGDNQWLCLILLHLKVGFGLLGISIWEIEFHRTVVSDAISSCSNLCDPRECVHIRLGRSTIRKSILLELAGRLNSEFHGLVAWIAETLFRLYPHWLQSDPGFVQITALAARSGIR